ncbi:GET complex subunit get1 [Lobosporangium transversale]|uniref:CHD5-like protein-domain-containing protein n=1 Tax=Lobosporangium transversale TaxID=64571 RepID=A0A1Y2GWT9_9FUNG|nr:CHD5-like protein-domain-containing protein [Lobosporangium transversale]KAF9919309.1 GET complex subunit get1 [Lobosporangium transversale]ORZ26725.1 CHD5-like protein-domain-containing protein [Lobosporangium transversale]|eukprot:XP_021884488.1 CHD5-like protein-domain-containing protein [Lobosporangium transversale]
MQLAIGVLLVVLLTELINFVGKTHVTAMAYDVYLKFINKDKVTKQRQLKKEVLTLKNDLSRTSSQDEFAKWAKLRRKMDSKIAELEKLTSELHLTKASFEIKFKSLLWFITNGIQFIMVAWYRRVAVFYVPPGWFGPAERFLALPFAETGAVSIAIWFYFCRKVIILFVSQLVEFIPAARALKPEQSADASSNNPFAAFANMASMASAAAAGSGGSPGGMGGNPFAAMANDFGAPGGMEGAPGMDAANMFGPGSPFAAMFGQTLHPDMMAGVGNRSGSGASSPLATSRSSSVRGTGNLGRGEDRGRRKA